MQLPMEKLPGKMALNQREYINMKKYSFSPIADENSKVLILGTIPGDESLRLGQYYANPMNQFWRIIASVVNESVPISYDDKKSLLLNNNIAIWDVLMHCEREGSLDSAIKTEFPNDFKTFFEEHKNIKAVFFNGGKGANYFHKHNLHDYAHTYITLPSTSSANTTKTVDEKKKIWLEEISKHL